MELPSAEEMMFEYNEKVKVKTKFCPECMDEDVDIDYAPHDLELREGWSKVKYLMPVVSCNVCGSISDAPEGIDATHDAACIAMGLLPPMEIKRIRKELGFTSAEKFAVFLGVGKATVKRWEARISFPDRNQIKLINILKLVGVEQFKRFSSIDPLFEGGAIRVKNKESNIIEFPKYRQVFSSYAGNTTDSTLSSALEEQESFTKRMIGR